MASYIVGDLIAIPFSLFFAMPETFKRSPEMEVFWQVSSRPILMMIGTGYIGEAEHWMQRAFEADARNGMRFHLGLDHALYGEYFKRQGERTKAHEELGKAIEILRKCGADGWVAKYEKESAALS